MTVTKFAQLVLRNVAHYTLLVFMFGCALYLAHTSHPQTLAFRPPATGSVDALSAQHHCWTNDGQDHGIPGHAIFDTPTGVRYAGTVATGRALDGTLPSSILVVKFCR